MAGVQGRVGEHRDWRCGKDPGFVLKISAIELKLQNLQEFQVILMTTDVQEPLL